MIFYRNYTRNNLTASADKARLRSRTLSSCKFICDLYIMKYHYIYIYIYIYIMIFH